MAEQGLEHDPLRLDDQLCFALYAATHAVVRSYRPRLAALGLTYPQYLVMVVLWQHRSTTVGALASRLDLDSHAVSPLVQRLEAAGLVTRRRGPDRRVVQVDLTPEGARLEAAASSAQADVVCATGLDAEELAGLRQQLHDLAEGLGHHDSRSRAHPAPGARAHGGETS